MNYAITKAVAIFRESPNLSDQEIYRRLVEAGVERATAARLVEFLPMAYCRLILASTGARFSDSFQRKLGDGTLSPERPLDSEPLWPEILSFTVAESRLGVPKSALLAIAGRSSEFDAANRLLHRGSKLGDVVFTTTTLQWPEEGPTL